MVEIDAGTRREIEKRTSMLLLDAGFKSPPVDVDVLIESLRLYKGYYDLTDPGFCRRFAHKIHVGAHRIVEIRGYGDAVRFLGFLKWDALN